MQLTMAQDEHSHRYSNIISGSGGGGGGGGNRSSLCSSKKQKQNRIPQRGLGVAQLEKIRLEEQQKREPKTIAITTPSPSPSPSSDLSIISSTNTSSSSSMAVVQHPNIGPNVVIPSTSQSHSQSYLSVQTPMNGQPSSIMPNLPMNVNIAGGKYMGFPAGGPMEQDHLGILNHGFGGFVSNTGLPYESNTVTTTTITIPPIWPTPIVMQRPLQFQQPYSSLMVNVLTSSSPSTPGINYQMDLPSSQSYSGNIYPSTNWPEEEKIVVGMKRPYSFSIDNAPGPCFPPPPTTFLSPLSRSDDSASCSHRIATTNTEPPNPVPRELTLISGGVTERNPKRMMTGTGGLSGEFLTLGQSRTLNPSSSSISPHQRPDFGSLPYQCGVENLMYGPRQGSSGSTQLPFINFLPPKETDNRNSASNVSSSGNGEKRGSVDTKLKL